MSPKFWTTVTESQFPWEREALEFVRERLPDRDPYRAWSNFEFIADDGSINEVDLLVLTPQGFFLVEIKSRPGLLRGDAGTWTWRTRAGKLITTDNPVFLANSKAKKLKSLLSRQRSVRKKQHQFPFIEPLIFCSAEQLQIELRDNAAHHICGRDRDATPERPAWSGIISALEQRDCPGMRSDQRLRIDKPVAKMVSQAMDQAGILKSQRKRKVSDYVLAQLLDQGPETNGRPAYQDWLGTHSKLDDVKRRVRIYQVRMGATEQERKTIEGAAQREARLLEALQHPGVLRREGFTDDELGPALIFEHHPTGMRLDHFLAQRGEQLGIEARLDILRQIAEVIRFAHVKKVVHRALSPQSILVTDPDSRPPKIKVFNWNVGYRAGTSTSDVSRVVSATSHVERLVEGATTAYMAPEALSRDDNTGEHLDVFSLGAIAYHLFSGQRPAEDSVELSNRLRETKGLLISSVVSGAGEWIEYMIRQATHPEVSQRTDSVAEFLQHLDEVEGELTEPDYDDIDDVSQARKGARLPGNLTVKARLGQGASSVALLVERDGREFVLKAANDPNHNDRLRSEAETLDKLRHQHIVKYHETLEIGDRVCLLMERAGKETLGERLRREGPLHVEFLQRFGEDLLGVVNCLEEHGIPHRDIKPDNIGIAEVGPEKKRHLVLFDFSLSRTAVENIHAGTSSYLDPMLPLRKPPRWDLDAERYGAAVTLYELATNSLPVWGDGKTEPSYLDCEVTIDAERLEATVRDRLSLFFARAMRRDPRDRFDNAEHMLTEWRHCFEGVDQPGGLSDHSDETDLGERLADAAFETPIHDLGLSARATNALDRANIMTVAALLSISPFRISRMRGVGKTTSREIRAAQDILIENLGRPETTDVVSEIQSSDSEEADVDAADVTSPSVDRLARLITKSTATGGGEKSKIITALLGLDAAFDQTWPGQSDTARHLNLIPVAVHQALKVAQDRWSREKAVTRLRDDLVEIVDNQGGAMSVEELAEAVLIARGCVRAEPERSRLAMAVTRAAVEVERTLVDTRLNVRRDRTRVIITRDQNLSSYAGRLGRTADQLAEQDPLVAPARVVEKLRSIQPREQGENITDARLVRMAVAVSQNAALSSRQELYPRGMDALRTLKLSQAALLGVRRLTVDEIRERVNGRYPQAAPLPDRIDLDKLLKKAGFDLEWKDAEPWTRGRASGTGCYVAPGVGPPVSSGSASVSRWNTSQPLAEPGEVTPELADARQFEERLQRALADGAFLALTVHPREYSKAQEALCRLPVQLVDVEAVFLSALKETAQTAGIDWNLVLRTDARPGEGDWDKLMLLVRRAVPHVEQQLMKTDKTLLIVYPGLIARYDQMQILDHLRENVGRKNGIPGAWLLLPGGDGHATINGKAVPVLGPGQRARIPDSWLRNMHRGGK